MIFNLNNHLIFFTIVYINIHKMAKSDQTDATKQNKIIFIYFQIMLCKSTTKGIYIHCLILHFYFKYFQLINLH